MLDCLGGKGGLVKCGVLDIGDVRWLGGRRWKMLTYLLGSVGV